MINLAENLVKALLPTLPPGAQERAIDPSEIVLSTGVRNIIDSITVSDWMSPNQPLAPIAPQGTRPRVFDYPFGANLFFQPRAEQPGSPDFNQLRMLAQYDIVRLCIETRKVQILEMPWAFRAKRQPGEKRTQYDKRNNDDDRIAQLNEFFKSPDHEHTFKQWMNIIVEEILVTDALSIWPVINQAQELIALRCLDGGTIKPLHDPQGWQPNPPNPAFQQIVKGSPAINLTAGLCDDCAKRGWHADAGKLDGRGVCLPLVYHPFNPTVNRFYGWSPTEQVLHTILIGMNRMVSQQALYTEGNLPEAIVGLPNEWGLEQVKSFQAFFDELAGNVSIKRRVRFVPGDAKFVQTKDPMIKDDRDDWLARVCCYAFSVAPNALVRQMNRASSQQLQESAVAEGKLPLLGQLSELITQKIVHPYFGPDFADIEHAYDTDTEADPTAQAKIDDMKIKNGSKSINESRDDDGADGVPGGDAYRIYLPTGPILLSDADAASANLAAPPAPPPPQFGAAPAEPGEEPEAPPAKPGKGKVPPQLQRKGKVPPQLQGRGKQLTPAAERETRKLLKLLPAHPAFSTGNGNGHRKFVY
jgi:hypothetical protein